VDPTQVENAVDLPNQMIANYLVDNKAQGQFFYSFRFGDPEL
jgi:hypothetical protein